MTDAAVARGQATRLPEALSKQVDDALARAVQEDWAARIWQRDTSVWTSDPGVAAKIADRLGWLDAPIRFADDVEELAAFAAGLRDEGFAAGLVCGMGGSSLAPDVLASALPRGPHGLPVPVLDSTAPAAVSTATSTSDPARTVYLIASKSGTTTETLSFLAHFWHIEDGLHADIPESLAGAHFVAISDPGKNVDAIPHHDTFREVFLNPEDVGGRYSALTYVGLVPGALLDLDLHALLGDAAAMSSRCRARDGNNPGVWLGVALGVLARAGRDKLTLVIEPRVAALGAWIEQLIAESTGKHGVGIVPVDGEPLGAPAVYGDDRIFVRVSSGTDEQWQAGADRALSALAAAGHPVIDLRMESEHALGGEFFRWEFATAVAGAVLGINPFDEPNVTESKENTHRVLEAYQRTGQLPRTELLAEQGALRLYGDAPLRLTMGHDGFTNELRRHLARVRPRGYYGLQAYLAPSAPRTDTLREMATLLRDSTQRAVTLGYGPRFLHSTGQLHKGGAPIGCFIQLTADQPDEPRIPGQHESFGTLISSQAAGDFTSLEAHELPVATINLSADPDAGLAQLREALDRALEQPLADDPRGSA
jgi:transaldolase/glucose-6-phosphate isomerase